jgi:hypothetical protein
MGKTYEKTTPSGKLSPALRDIVIVCVLKIRKRRLRMFHNTGRKKKERQNFRFRFTEIRK